MKTLIDQIGTSHTFNRTPQRIISLVPSLTELLFDLGLEDQIVGITKFCVHPIHFKSPKTIVGGTKNVKSEKIKALHPDIIIANKEENTKEIVEELSKICPVWVTNIITVDDNFKLISDFGELFNCKNEAQNWSKQLTVALNDFKNFIEDRPIQKVAYFIWKNPYMVVGSDNFINEMLQLNHFRNIFDKQGRYPEIELSKMQSEVNQNLVLLSSEPYPFQIKDAEEINSFLPQSKIIFVDGEMFSWYGTRLLKALGYFKQLHREL